MINAQSILNLQTCISYGNVSPQLLTLAPTLMYSSPPRPLAQLPKKHIPASQEIMPAADFIQEKMISSCPTQNYKFSKICI